MKPENLRIALAFGGVSVTPDIAKMIVEMSEKMDEMGDAYSLKDHCRIEAKYLKKRDNELAPVMEVAKEKEITIVADPKESSKPEIEKSNDRRFKSVSTLQKEGEEYMRLKEYPKAVIAFGRALEKHIHEFIRGGDHDRAPDGKRRKLEYQLAVAKSMVNEQCERDNQPMKYSSEETDLSEPVGDGIYRNKEGNKEKKKHWMVKRKEAEALKAMAEEALKVEPISAEQAAEIADIPLEEAMETYQEGEEVIVQITGEPLPELTEKEKADFDHGEAQQEELWK